MKHLELREKLEKIIRVTSPQHSQNWLENIQTKASIRSENTKGHLLVFITVPKGSEWSRDVQTVTLLVWPPCETSSPVKGETPKKSRVTSPQHSPNTGMRIYKQKRLFLARIRRDICSCSSAFRREVSGPECLREITPKNKQLCLSFKPMKATVSEIKSSANVEDVKAIKSLVSPLKRFNSSILIIY